MIRLTPQKIELEAAAGDTPRRTFIGLAAPYGVPAVTMDGTKVEFAEGALPSDGPAPKLLEYHDSNRPVGIVLERVSIPGVGMSFAAKISDTAAGRDALTLVKDGVLDSVSVGVEPIEFSWEGDTMVVTKAAWNELSLVTAGAFAAAKIETVYAAAQTDEPAPADAEGEPTPTQEEKPEMETPEVIEASAPTEPTNPLVFAQPRRVVPMPTAAEYISAAVSGGDQWRAMSEAIRAAAPDIVTTDTPGILPTPILAPVYNNFIGRRPVVDAVGVRAMPGGGKIFIRPEVTTHSSIGASIGEQSPTAGTMVVFNNQVTKQIFGGYVNISEADMDWSDPNIISIVLDDMGRIYSNATDNYAADQLVAGATTTKAFADFGTTADPEAWVKAAYYAASTILSASNGNLPNMIAVAPDTFQLLGQLSDTSDRPLFPQVGPMNAFGQMSPGSTDATAFGLRVVVDRNFAAGTLIIGDSSGYELFEQQKGAISIDSPSTLSRTIAFRGYFAALMIDASKFVKFV
jgi:HK97 family phage prohead protease